MHCDAGSPHWKLIRIQKSQKAHRRTDRQKDGWMDGCTDGQTYNTATQGIWPRGLRLHDLREITGCANDLQKATRENRQRYIDTKRQKDIETDRHTYNLYWTPLGYSAPQCGDINSSQRWTPTLEINTNTKKFKAPRENGRMDGHIILPLRGFDPMACGCMRCAQIQT